MNEQANTMTTDTKSVAYGAKLKAAREAIGLEQKDIAAQLRLGEKIIEMLESGHYSPEVPITFIRGYIRSYSKLLQIADSEVATALEPIKAAPTLQETSISKQPTDLTSSNYYMQFSTYAIGATLSALLGLWWYNHTPAHQSVVAQNETLAIPEVQNSQENKQLATASTSASLATSMRQAQQPNVAVNSETNKANLPTSPSLASIKPSTPHISSTADEEDDEEDNGNNRD